MQPSHITHLEHRLSPHFTLAELTVSQTAERAGLRNVPVGTALANLERLALFLEQVRALLFNAPILVSSGYRSPQVNRRVGGAPTSAHTKGLAADFIAPRYGRPKAIAEAIRDSALPFDQLIHEGTWVHLAIAPAGQAPRRSVLTAVFHRGQPTQYLQGIV
jgi:zinc D-Ala-D-Ala carboxypeptidase